MWIAERSNAGVTVTDGEQVVVLRGKRSALPYAIVIRNGMGQERVHGMSAHPLTSKDGCPVVASVPVSAEPAA